MSTVLHGLNDFLAFHRDRGVAPDLLGRWHSGMETQVLVSSAGGSPVEEKPGCYTDGMKSWWNIRVPKNADSEPEFNDYPLNWMLGEHADCIGSTGWDWKARASRWVGFDFDALVGHAKGVGVSDEALEEVRQKAQALPYVEVRRSTGGAGLHLYVHVEVPTENHTVHAALARCVLGMMSTETGFDFASRIDCCGGNMWIWRKDLEPGGLGLSLIKAATHALTESDLPSNWRDHISVVKKKRGKMASDESVAALSTAIQEVPLDEEHKLLMSALAETGYETIWINDYHCLHTKTKALQDIFDAGGIKGVFRTVSEGNEPSKPNCYMFPLENGAWKVFRFGNASEADTWTTDNAGRTTCFFNKRATLKTAALFFGGVEDADNNEFVFTDGQGAIDTAMCLGDELTLPEQSKGREVRLGKSKDGRLIAKIKKETKEKDLIPGWLDKKSSYYKVLKKPLDETEDSLGPSFDDAFRKLRTATGGDAGWMLRDQDGWSPCEKDEARNLLESMGEPKSALNAHLGSALFKPWRLVNLPFQDEYPGGRKWNLGAAQLAYEPAESDGVHPHWDIVMRHCGAELNEIVKELPWCIEDRIHSGADYLTAWLACLFRCTFEPLPYLFFHGDQDCGKSMFHEAAALLMTAGYVIADKALTNGNSFNGELGSAILCAVEEVDVASAPGAYAKIKDWVTSRNIAIRKMRTDVYQQPNTSHWVQVANEPDKCPIFPNDTRITMMEVTKPEVEIPKPILLQRLREEAPQFLRTLTKMELPAIRGRLRLPMIETASKKKAANVTAKAICSGGDILQKLVNRVLKADPDGAVPLTNVRDLFVTCYTSDERKGYPQGVTKESLSKLDPPVVVKLRKGKNYIVGYTMDTSA